MNSKRALVIAHRGVPGWPENSLAGIRAAGEVGADIVEIDVRRTLTGAPAVVHDWNLARVTGARGTVGGTLGRIPVWVLPRRLVVGRRLAGGDERVPTLDEALAALPQGVELGVHVKDASALRATLAVIERAGMVDRCWLWIREARDMARARERLPTLRVTLLNTWQHERPVSRYLAKVAAARATAISVPWGWVTPEFTAEAHALGLLVFSREERPEELAMRIAAGLDGAITDDPARMRAVVDR